MSELEKQVCPTCLRPKRYVADVLDELKDEITETLRDLDATVGANTEVIRAANLHAPTLHRVAALLDQLIQVEQDRVGAVRDGSKHHETQAKLDETKAKLDHAERKDRRAFWLKILVPIVGTLTAFGSGLGSAYLYHQYGYTAPAEKPAISAPSTKEE